MSKLFVITNQHGHFINKHKEWVDGSDPKVLFRTPHKDEAINLVFELSSRDIYLRAEAIGVELDDHQHPVVEISAEPLPEVPPAQDEVSETSANAGHQETV